MQWTQSAILPLHKKGSIYNVNNYRGISLLNILGKVFSHVLNERLKLWCEWNEIIPEAQAGFRSHYSTVDNIFSLQCIIQKYIGKAKGRFYVFFVDFYKAFDWVNRQKLWYCLSKNGCHGKMFDVIKSMYHSVLCSVRVLNQSMEDRDNNDLSSKWCITDFFECLSGVKQGCVLSPILFSVFISEFEKELQEESSHGVEILTNKTDAFSLLYADDLALFSDTVTNLQSRVRHLEAFCNKWKLKVNVEKSKIIVFRNGGYLRQSEKYWFEGNPIEVATYFSYLGLLFSSRLNWSKCIDNQSNKAIIIINCIRRLFTNNESINFRTAVKIFDIKIKPLLLYGSEIWGTKVYEKIENAQIKYFKSFLGIGKTTENCFILREVGRYPMWVDTKYRAIKYWCKLLRLSEDRYPKKCYLQQYNLVGSGRLNWVSEIKGILLSCGYGYVWQTQKFYDETSFLKEFKERLISLSWQEIEGNLRSKFPYYLDIHPYHETAQYIDLMNKQKQRRLITLLRTSSLPIANNLFRIKAAPSQLCSRCMSGEVEDELHLFCDCQALSQLRNMYLPSLISCSRHEAGILLHAMLLSSNNKSIMNLCSYVDEAVYQLV